MTTSAKFAARAELLRELFSYNIVSDGDLRDVARKLAGGDVITTGGTRQVGL